MARLGASFIALAAGLLLSSCGGGGGGSSSSGTSTTGDTAPPVVTSTNPSDNSIGVPVNAPVAATFNETFAAASPATAFTLAQGGVPVPGTVTLSGTLATFTPAQVLGNNLTYTATLGTGIKDLAGNALAAPHTWSFITSDCNAITLAKQFDLGPVTTSATLNKALATDGAAIYIWLQADFTSTYGTLFKVDPQAGTILSTVNVPLVPMSPTSTLNGIQFVSDIAWHNGAIWASGVIIGPGGSFPQSVFRINQTTGLAENAIPISAGVPGEVTILGGLASDGTNLFLAMDRQYYTPAAPTDHLIVKFNPATSTSIPLAPALLTTVGQAGRLDYGGGYLWVFNNPNFEKVDPLAGTVLANYCKTDGGGNILFLNGQIWTIKDTVLQAYNLP